MLEDSLHGVLNVFPCFSSLLLTGLVELCQQRTDYELGLKFSEKPLEGLEVQCS